MEQLEKAKRVLQWHPAFVAGLQIEFEDEIAKMHFESEYQLGTKPKEIDVLIIKKNDAESIEKNIGRIFRKHNIVEYKSPEDYLSIDDFYKVYGYACFYKSDAVTENRIRANIESFQEGKEMCEAIIELFQDEYDRGIKAAREEALLEGRLEGRMEGRLEGRMEGLRTLADLVRDNLLPLNEAVKRAKISEEEFLKLC